MQSSGSLAARRRELQDRVQLDRVRRDASLSVGNVEEADPGNGLEEYDLPPQLGKATDPRAAAFVEKHGRLIQVEVEALPPETLKRLYDDAIEPFLDRAAYEAAMTQERIDRQALRDLAAESHLSQCHFQAKQDHGERDDG
jgi:hypothetical protein